MRIELDSESLPKRGLYNNRYGRCKNSTIVECINMENQAEPPDFMIVFTRCGEKNFSIYNTKIPAVGLNCNPETNTIDCKEAIPMLNFIINTYDAPLAKKYVFAHAHDTSWHYTTNFFDVLAELVKTKYFTDGEPYGGVYNERYRGSCGWREKRWLDPLYNWVFSGTSMPEKPITENNLRPCCSTFWMESRLVHTRKKSEYILIRDRLREWSKKNMRIFRGPGFYCSRTMEYTWHILFANQSSISQCKECKLTKMN